MWIFQRITLSYFTPVYTKQLMLAVKIKMSDLLIIIVCIVCRLTQALWYLHLIDKIDAFLLKTRLTEEKIYKRFIELMKRSHQVKSSQVYEICINFAFVCEVKLNLIKTKERHYSCCWSTYILDMVHSQLKQQLKWHDNILHNLVTITAKYSATTFFVHIYFWLYKKTDMIRNRVSLVLT